MVRLSIDQLASLGKRLARLVRRSILDSKRSLGESPWVAVCWALSSIIMRGISTEAGQSTRHWWQWKHRSAIFRISSLSAWRTAIRPERRPRSRLAFALGEASSARDERNIGHMRSFGAVERHRPQPLQEFAVASSVCDSFQSRIGRNVELGLREVSMSMDLLATVSSATASLGTESLATESLATVLLLKEVDAVDSTCDFDFLVRLSEPFFSSFFRSRTRVP